ncbi:hypothetical protein GCM10025868_04200 [Angustibacter aerolatus]|uniref:Major facilitator superfamily (MFS) profile domain-containing protein n=1 Tax=Angustibacter aerolatus TaxID=1162965 RepID=A0ABQ6JAF7_9ACTN|nr:hypothetical protein GCM10025868_04200 [Angustibacter aerolatus]
MLRDYPSRSFLGFSMMVTQAFLYNAIFFTYALVLANVYDVKASHIGYFFFPFALGNLAGPLLLGHLFDTVGRRKMILATYGGSAILLAISAALFGAGVLSATTQTIFWCVIFFFASAGASSAYLTVSEIFPLEPARPGDLVLLRDLAGGRRRRRTVHLRQGSSATAATAARSPSGTSSGRPSCWPAGSSAGSSASTPRKSLEDIADPLSSVKRTEARGGTRFQGAAPKG